MMLTNPEDDKRAALQRIRGGMDEVPEHAFFIGNAVKGLAESYGIRRGTVHFATSLETGRQLLIETFPAQGKSPKVLLVVALGSETDSSFEPLQRLVEPLDRLLGPDPRTVLIGEARFSDFGSVRSLLWSHVVDWLPAGLQEKAVLQRLDQAWKRNSFRRRLLGLGLVPGAPRHVATHHLTRLQMAKDFRLDRLSAEPLFQAAMKSADGAVPWDSFADDLYYQLRSAIRHRPEQWAEAFDLSVQQLSDLKSSGLREREDRLLLLRFWCAFLANRVEDIMDMTRKDLRELEEYANGVEHDFLNEGGADV